jgi:hypothetical protein
MEKSKAGRDITKARLKDNNWTERTKRTDKADERGD